MTCRAEKADTGVIKLLIILDLFILQQCGCQRCSDKLFFVADHLLPSVYLLGGFVKKLCVQAMPHG